MKMKRIYTLLAALMTFGAASFAQGLPGSPAQPSISWESETSLENDSTVLLTLKGTIGEGLHTYDLTNEYSPTSVTFSSLQGCVKEGDVFEISRSVPHDGMKVFYDEITLGQKFKLTDGHAVIKGSVSWLGCTETSCGMPEEWEFEVRHGAVTEKTAAAASVRETPANARTESSANTWALIIEAILWGFAMLLTPCVFPMVPMTVSFFMKGSSSKAAGRFKATMYGIFIVLLYTVPISLIILITNIIGGDAVTSDIFNWLSTHWLPNIIFFIVFMVFAASFFGAFEITMPQSIVNKSDKGADKGGLMGIFFMALTLVLVSFSCTGPIVGTVLIKSTQGEVWTPMVTMLAFSIAFALPFTLLAFFPSLLKNLKKSGGSWLNSVKVVLGFIELALGLKFLSVADQTYHWGILDREIYLAIWIVIFSLLGFYLLGKIQFAHDEKVEKLSVKRLALAIASFTFVVYMIPGLFGAPLKALSGYLPPITTQDFVLGQETTAAQTSDFGKKYNLHLPLGIEGYFTLEEGMEAAKKNGKPIFLDITGHGCVNCREMESRVWSDPAVLGRLKNDFVVVALYTDDKTGLDEEDWVKGENGEVFRQIGRANSYIVRNRFNVNSQPTYIILDENGNQLSQPYGYNLKVDAFIEFLDSAHK